MLEVVVHDDDVRVFEAAGHPRLAEKALGMDVVGNSSERQLLERNFPIEIGLARQIHPRHPAVADLTENLVSADPAKTE